jgi:hypothetical protein
LKILKTINYEKCSPKIICVESVPYGNKTENLFDIIQTNDLTKFLISKNYSIRAFTLLNTIFVRNELTENG